MNPGSLKKTKRIEKLLLNHILMAEFFNLCFLLPRILHQLHKHFSAIFSTCYIGDYTIVVDVNS